MLVYGIMNVTNFYSTVFMFLIFGGYVSFIQGIPTTDFAKKHLRTRKSLPLVILSRNRSTSFPIRYEVISRSVVEQPKVSKECDDEDECKPGSGTGDETGEKIPISELLPALERDLTPVDAFAKDESTKGNNDATYEIISKSITSNREESTPKDAFIAEESAQTSSPKNDGVIYEIISKSVENGVKTLKRKDCDDEDECGSAVDVFTFDGDGGDVIIRGLSLSKAKPQTARETRYYEVMSKSMLTKDKLPRRDCDDEDECGSANDDFSNDGSGDDPLKEEDSSSGKTTIYEVISKSMQEKSDSTPVDAYNPRESPSSTNDRDVIYEVILKSMENKDQNLTPTDAFTTATLPTSSPNKEGRKVTNEIISKSMENGDKAPTPTDALSAKESTTSSSSKEDTKVIYEIISKSKENGDEAPTPTDALSAKESPTTSSNKKDTEVIYEIISKSKENEDKKPSSKECDDEDECGSADDDFNNDGSGEEDIMEGLSPQKDKEESSEKTTIYEVVIKSMVEKEDSTPTDAFTSEKKSKSSSKNGTGDVTYEIISKTMTNRDKDSIPTDAFTSDEKSKGSSKKETGDVIYEIISKSITNRDKDSTPTDAFTSDEKSKSSSETETGDAMYEIISRTVTNGDKAKSKKSCDDEDECGSAEDVFSNRDTGGEVTKGLSTQKDKDVSSEKTIYYEIISKKMEDKDDATPTDTFMKENDGVTYEIISQSMKNREKAASRKDCDDEDECGSADDIFINDGSEKEMASGLSPTKDKDQLSKKATYEVISRIILEKDNLALTDAFTAGESSKSPSSTGKKEVVHEVISKVITSGDKDVSKKNCDDEDECGSAEDAFVNDDGSGEYEITKGPSTSTDEDLLGKTSDYEVISKKMVETQGSSVDDTFTAEDDAKYEIISKIMTDRKEDSSPDDTQPPQDDARYEIITKTMTDGEEDSSPNDTFTAKDDAKYEIMSKTMTDGEEKSSLNECDDDDEDCALLNGGSGEDTFNERRAYSPQKQQVGRKVSVESTVRPLFRGTSFALLPPLRKDAEDNVEAEMEIYPLEATGLLLYNGWEPDKIGYFISLSIKDGLVELSFDCHSGPVKIRTLEPIKIGEWNKVKFSRTGRLGTLTLNRDYSVFGFSPEPGSALILNTNLMIGGVPEKLRSEIAVNVGIDRGFTGYIRNLKIQRKPVDLHLASIAEDVQKHPCQHLPCKNGGQCVVNNEDYSCVCKAKYRGRHCEEEIDLKPIAFHRNSYVRFNKAVLLQILQGQDGVVSFFIQTTQSRGLLLREVQKLTKLFQRHATIGLKIGFISLSFNLGTGRRQVHSTVPVNDGAWHNVTVARRKRSCALIIDSKHKTKFNAFNGDLSMETSIDLYIGGIPNIKDETKGLHKTGFKGCLKNFQINSKYLDFVHEYIASQGTSYCSDN